MGYTVQDGMIYSHQPCLVTSVHTHLLKCWRNGESRADAHQLRIHTHLKRQSGPAMIFKLPTPLVLETNSFYRIYIYILYIYIIIYTLYIYIEWNLVFFQVLQTWVIPFTLVGPGFQSRVRLKSLNVTSHVVNWLRNHENSPRFWLQMFQSDQDHGYLDQDHDIWIRFWLLWIQRSSNIHDLWYVPVCRCPACHHLSSLVIPSNTGETAETRHDGQTQLLGHGTPDPKGAARCQFPSWKNGKKRKRTEFHRDFMRITLGFNRDFMR